MEKGQPTKAKNKKISKKDPQGAGRGRSKKRKSSKSKEPFSRIASQLVPAAAIATAIPKSAKVIGKSRSPSPLGRAIAFTAKIGQTIAGGKVLTRSLSEQQLSRTNVPQAEIALSNKISRSQPGPSRILDDDYDDEPGYASVEDVRGSAWEKRRQLILQNQNSPIDKRPPMPLPFEEEVTDGRPANVEDLYSKVRKHTVEKASLEKANDSPNYDSDDITSVSEMDEEVSSRLGVPRRNSRSSKTKQKEEAKSSTELQVEETSDGPSEGEIYRLPFDHVTMHEKPSGIQFQTIEEFEEDDISLKSKKTGLHSSSASLHKGSPREPVGRPPLERTRSSQSITSDQDKPPSRPQTPREMGKEAALRRLEEMGFDGMSKEIGMYSSLNFRPKKGVNQPTTNRFVNESTSETVGADFNESSPLFEGDDPQSVSNQVAEMRKRFQTENVLSSEPKNMRIAAEEPLMSTDNILQEYASEELRLDDLIDDDDYEQPVNHEGSVAKAVDFGQRDAVVKSSNDAVTNTDETVRKSYSKGDQNKGGKPHLEVNSNMMENEISKMMQTTEDELRKQRDIQRVVLDNQAKIQEQMNGLYNSLSQNPEHNDVTEAKYQSNMQQQLQMQHEMERKQQRMLETISGLELQIRNMGAQSLSDNKQQKNQQLIELRKMILEEQKKYVEQQKLIEEQQNKILKTQRSNSPRKQSRSRSSLSLSPSSPRRPVTATSPRAVHAEQPVQFVLLESRLKAVEAERQTLIDLNASMQEENDALKKMSLTYDDGGTSGIIYKKQNKDLIETNNNLKALVHRLNIELSRFQAKHRPPRKEEVEGLSLPEEGPVPHWLINTKYLSPLVLAYDDRMKDKNELIRAYEIQLASFKSRMLEIVRENQKLHLINNEKADDRNIVAVDEWNLLQEQARLVVEENSILMQEIDLKDKRIEELQQDWQSEALLLSKQIRIIEKEKNQIHSNFTSLQFEIESLKKKYEDVVIESKGKIPEGEFQSKLTDMKRLLSSEINNLKLEKEDSITQLQAVCKEKQRLAVKLTDTAAKNSELQIELDLTSKALRKAEKRLIVSKKNMDTSKEKELIATETLTQVLSVAEKNARDRNELAKMIQSQNADNLLKHELKKEDDFKLDILQSHLKKYKKLSKQKENEITERIKEKDIEMAKMRSSYEQEIKDLKEMLRERQNVLDLVQSQERQFENEIDSMWRSVAAENEQLKKSI